MFEKLKEGLRSVVDRISQSELTEKELEPILWELQMQLIANDVAVEVAGKVCAELAEHLRGEAAPRFGDKSALVREALRSTIRSLMTNRAEVDLLELAARRRAEGRPLVVLFVGINGTGKTTTIAKMANLLMDHGYRVVLASGDTYRAGAIEQLEEHARRLGVRVVKHGYGADPAAVSYDAVQHAAARSIDAVLIDTAGRMQTNRNLMDELNKIKRVVQPDLTVMVVDALTGNDATEQAEAFNSRVGFDAAVLAKVDADAKGGSSLSVAYLTGKPIIYVGTGQGYDDLQPFDAEWFTDKILPEE
ncbi:cell division protein FtsY [miscellaneous Crenarchaeota group-15 archaeon DG-45]|uniref:Signal recognition particle receptor FtsY n=1 Tax=miscellaneous Crenarchaeota group-15 archaeon DG-45 TaxID=1685127 RepID=A0A0M0BSW6_9ARCH|nr:MAG: cell division protein FtsY [miscellaneous Crenarchaeota group-15 archaeon DG-45]